MSLTVDMAETWTYTAPGDQRPKIPDSATLTYTQSDTGIFPIPDGTDDCCGFQISPDDIDIITGYRIKNNTGFNIAIAPNDWDSFTLAPGGIAKWYSPDDGSGWNPVYYVYIYTEHVQEGDGSVEFAFFGDNFN